jgi:lipoprotein-anchoring transpeptidase ErfK/SrfK
VRKSPISSILQATIATVDRSWEHVSTSRSDMRPTSSRSQRTVYTAPSPRSRGRRYTYIGAAVLLVALAATAAWQVITAPRILAVSPAPGSFLALSTITVKVHVSGLNSLSGVTVRLDDKDVTRNVVYHGDDVTLRQSGLSDGTHFITLTASTNNLYRRHVRRTWQFNVDTTAPALTVSSPSRGAQFTTNPVVFSGTAEPGTRISGDAHTGASVLAGPDGSYSISLTLKDGRLNVPIHATDKAGNVATVRRMLTIDTQAPVLTVTALGTATVNDPQVRVYTVDPVSTPRLTVTIDGTTVANRRQHGTRTMHLGTLSEGTHTIALTSTDSVGHVATHNETFVVDSTEKLGNATLGPGAVGADVKQLQKLLKLNHLYHGARTGIYDAATAKAVRGMQKRLRETPTSLAAPNVVAALTGRIVVDQTKLKLYFYLYGKLKFVFPVATGQPAWPTPDGVFHIVVMSKDPTWIPPDSPWAKGLEPVPAGPGNPLGTRWMGTSAPGVGIHGCPEDWSIGSHASHGCVRMHIRDAETLYNYVKVGMPVIIHW